MTHIYRFLHLFTQSQPLQIRKLTRNSRIALFVIGYRIYSTRKEQTPKLNPSIRVNSKDPSSIQRVERGFPAVDISQFPTGPEIQPNQSPNRHVASSTFKTPKQCIGYKQQNRDSQSPSISIRMEKRENKYRDEEQFFCVCLFCWISL